MLSFVVSSMLAMGAGLTVTRIIEPLRMIGHSTPSTYCCGFSGEAKQVPDPAERKRYKASNLVCREAAH
jgi:hypothetical protein